MKKGNRYNKITVAYIIMEMTSEEVMVGVKKISSTFYIEQAIGEYHTQYLTT